MEPASTDHRARKLRSRVANRQCAKRRGRAACCRLPMYSAGQRFVPSTIVIGLRDRPESRCSQKWEVGPSARLETDNETPNS